MYRQAISLLLLGVSLCVTAQVTERTYLDQYLKECKKSEAAFVKEYKGQDGKYHIAQMLTMNGKLKMRGQYADPELRIEHGKFEYYHADGQLESKGEYEMGYKSGVWKRYNTWGKELAEKVYDTEILAVIVYTLAEKMPTYPGGEEQLASYLDKTIGRSGTRGKKTQAKASFIVEKDGMVTDVRIMEKADPSTDQRIMRALEQMPNWQPGMERGQNVRVRMVLPIML